MEMPGYAKVLCVITFVLVMAAYGYFVKWLFETHSYWWAVPLGLATFGWAFWQDHQDKKETERLAEAQAEWEDFWGNDWWDETEEDADIIDGEYRVVFNGAAYQSRLDQN